MHDQATKLRAIAGSAARDQMPLADGSEFSDLQRSKCDSPRTPRVRGGKAQIQTGSFPVRTIAITSGKGGVGKTNIAVNMGLAMAAQNRRVGIIDADLGLANIDVILKLKPKYNIEHVIAGRKTLEEIFIRGPAGLTIIPASSGKMSLANLPHLERNRLMRELARSTSDFDIMFIDTAAGISHNVVDFALAAQEVIVITTPEPTAITDAYAMIKVISQLKRTDIGIIVNMVDNAHQAQEVAARLITAAKRFINAKADFMGHILTDVAVSDAVSAQQPLIFRYPQSGAAQCINVPVDRIMGNERRI